jgi:NAD(P)-dependent dehydrogenase (short-subunit alcohol dehydrogenase family)
MAFRGNVVLVTGAASGMGRCTARQLAGQGARVAALDRNEEALHQLARERPGVAAYPLDVTDARAVESVVADVEDRIGAIDRVVNAAGIMPTGLLHEQGRETIARVMEVNYGGTVNVTLAVLPRMLTRGSGDLINFASIAGWVPNLHFGAYAASKFAVVAFTEVLAHENRDSGLRFACVCPSKVRTPLLQQAKSHPRILETGPEAMEPERVLAAVESALEHERLFVFPGWHTAAGVRLRRFAPRLLWAVDHWVEES